MNTIKYTMGYFWEWIQYAWHSVFYYAQLVICIFTIKLEGKLYEYVLDNDESHSHVCVCMYVYTCCQHVGKFIIETYTFFKFIHVLLEATVNTNSAHIHFVSVYLCVFTCFIIALLTIPCHSRFLSLSPTFELSAASESELQLIAVQ